MVQELTGFPSPANLRLLPRRDHAADHSLAAADHGCGGALQGHRRAQHASSPAGIEPQQQQPQPPGEARAEHKRRGRSTAGSRADHGRRAGGGRTERPQRGRRTAVAREAYGHSGRRRPTPRSSFNTLRYDLALNVSFFNTQWVMDIRFNHFTARLALLQRHQAQPARRHVPKVKGEGAPAPHRSFPKFTSAAMTEEFSSKQRAQGWFTIEVRLGATLTFYLTWPLRYLPYVYYYEYDVLLAASR